MNSTRTVLGIDTSTLTAGVAIARGDATTHELLAACESSVRTHSQRLLGLIDKALTACSLTLAQLDAIAIGAGPGSFTGLRIGMATAKGLAFSTGKPLWAVSSLAALAASVAGCTGVDRDTVVVPILDARRSEVFAGFYLVDGNRAHAIADEIVIAPDALADRLAAVLESRGSQRAVSVGDGLSTYPQLVRGLGEGTTPMTWAASSPPAAAAARLALAGEHADVVLSGAPSYIRLSEAEIKYPDGNPGGSFRPRG